MGPEASADKDVHVREDASIALPTVPSDPDEPQVSHAICLGEGYPESAIGDLLSSLAAHYDAGVALVGSSERLTHRELFHAVLHIAHQVATAVPQGGSVATLVPNSPSGFAGILGCLVAPRICIVLDPTLPRERIAVILQDAKPDAILLLDETSPHRDVKAAPGEVSRLVINKILGAPASTNWLPQTRFDPDEPALVHYTSGSTGQPKGIVISTRAALRRSQVYLDAWHINPSDRFLATFQPSTNSGLCSSFAALCGGARVLLHSLASEGAGSLFKLARQEGLTLLDAVPSIIRLLVALDGAKDAFSRLRVLRGGGESMLQADIANWRAVLPASCRIAHAYASTEAMFGAFWFVPSDYTSPEPRLPAGYPLRDQEYALVDEVGAAVPVGQPGELVLRSRHVACGEWRDGGCIPGRILPDPEQPGRRVLRTGDLLRLGDDNLLRFVSRVDRQIKLHGVRVEPAEIESVIRRTEGVLDAAVTATALGEEIALIAYVAADEACHVALRPRLRDRLRAELPAAMLPSRIVLLNRLPYLPGGKVDMGSLLSLGRRAAAS